MSDEADFDVIIIGCGMAGMACAAQLLKEGVEGDRILVVDRGEPIGAEAPLPSPGATSLL